MAFDDIERWKELGKLGEGREVALLDELLANGMPEEWRPGVVYVNNCYQLRALPVEQLAGMSDKEFVKFLYEDVFEIVQDTMGRMAKIPELEWHRGVSNEQPLPLRTDRPYRFGKFRIDIWEE